MDDRDAYIRAAANALGIPLQPDWLPAVRFHLDLSLRLGAEVAAFPLPDEADPAPVYRA